MKKARRLRKNQTIDVIIEKSLPYLEKELLPPYYNAIDYAHWDNWMIICMI